ncbi:MAG: GTPase Era [Candidatus Xenobia bacterium]
MTHSGFIAIVGKPNVGKSTLTNALVGFKIAPVSPRPQTTRRQVRGIWTEGTRQIVFVDTPGLHKPADALDSYMQKQIREALEEVDVIIWMADLRHPPTDEDRMVAEILHGQPNVMLIGNKVDAAKRPAEALEAYHALLPEVTQVRSISALDLLATATLRQDLLRQLPEGPWYFPSDSPHSDQDPRQWAAEIVREAALQHLRQELPYSLAVKVDVYEERASKGGAILYMHALLVVEREAHKPILIGHEGSMLKKIGQRARKGLEALLGRKIFLDLEVKVYPGWRKDQEALRELDLN